MALLCGLMPVGLWGAVQFLGQTPPAGLGVTNGSLADCPATPNCICSDCDSGEKMAPLKYFGDAENAMVNLTETLKKLGIPVVERQGTYLHAVATTPIMRFKDDIEFLIVHEEGLIHFRSASRLGKSDLGKNRQRMNRIIEALGPRGIKPTS